MNACLFLIFNHTTQFKTLLEISQYKSVSRTLCCVSNNNYSKTTPKRLLLRVELLSFIDIIIEIWHLCIINKQHKREIEKKKN